ncbi:uncharacterized protein [Venturia canescens]|uniref:uncharacterized protein isoform X2 n=1 Tax=Venturia canescens TaxID=32260 RepID=UPI001C9D0BA1|nr:uncharacterized protein LOC122413274 isoform X2 [Venturia canescens]
MLTRISIVFLIIHLQSFRASGWPSAFKLWSTYHENEFQSEQARVLNFFPVPVEEECMSEDKRRRGICMNTYECRIQQGQSHGPCALGFGVCCIFTTSCGGEVQNNLTYVLSPGFPNLVDQPLNCSIFVKRIEPHVSQLRIDFVHFNIGQPNRKNGLCDQDLMEVKSGGTSIQICGWNSGQHIYMDVDEEGTMLEFRLPNAQQSRMWEMRVVQLAFEQRAPAGCLQYFDAPRGTLKTLNYLPNGRYLANQDYLLCVRQERGMCSISYSPCTVDSFRIGPSRFPMRNASADPMTGSATVNNGAPTNQNNQNLVEGSGTEDTTVITNLPTTSTRCSDRVLIPCDFEEFITPGNDGAGLCDLEHCGNSLCGPNEIDADGNCRVETSATPFHIRIAFGAGDESGNVSVEDKAGMCLTFEQLPCMI